jgi:hypothetical protein
VKARWLGSIFWKVLDASLESSKQLKQGMNLGTRNDESWIE